MTTFVERLETFKKDRLIDYLYSLKKPCYESQLLKIAFDPVPDFLNDHLELYQVHFVLFNQLYHLQSYFTERDYYLHIHFMRTMLLPYPESGKCRFYNPDFGNFCNTETEGADESYCDFHRAKVEDTMLENTSLRYFYLDESNFDNINEENAKDFIEGTWEYLFHYEKYEKARILLDLPEKFTVSMLKTRFKQKAKETHPDVFENDSSDKSFIEINNAYRLLLKLLPVFEKKNTT